MIKRAKNKVERMVEVQKAKLLLKRLQKHNNIDIRTFAAILKSTISNNKCWTEDEQESLGRINEIRNEILSSKETVNIMDYGSASTISKRTKEQMSAGTATTKNIADIGSVSSTGIYWGELIFKIIRNYKPENCLELGTCLGLSGAYQISALKLNGHGKFTTIEGSAELAKHANSNLKKINYKDYVVHNGRFLDVLPTILSDTNKLVDFVFIDGHHDKIATWEYFELIYSATSKKSIFIFDDINWSEGMKDVWQRIYMDKRISVSFDIGNWGICFIDQGNRLEEKKHYKLRLQH